MDTDTSLGSQDTVQNPASVTPTDNGATVTDAAKDLKEHNSKVYSSGLNDGLGRAAKDVFKHFKNLGIDPVNDNIDETFAQLAERLQKQGGQQDEEFKKRLEAVSVEATTWKTKAEQAETEKNQYILNHQILSSIGQMDVVDANAVATLFQSEYKVQRVADGQVHVYDKSGKLLKTNAWEDVTLADAMKKFLEERPYLVKSQSRASTAATSQTGSPYGVALHGTKSDAETLKAARERMKNI